MSDETVQSVGEFGLIERLRAVLPRSVSGGPALAVGIGDDAAVWSPPVGEDLLVTSDALLEGVHFDPSWRVDGFWRSLGWKSLAVNVSDIAAMGGDPSLAEVTLGLQPDMLVDDVLDLYRGLADAATQFGIVIAGGDIVRSPAGMVIAVTLIGASTGGRVLTRAGARPGDVIGVSGALGAAAAGLELLTLPDSDKRRQSATAAGLIDALLHPVPRVALGRELLAGGATAAMDLSDGLLGDLPKILEMSDVAASVQVERVPSPAAVMALFPERARRMALHGGEDYELLFSIPPASVDALARAAEVVGSTVSIVGTVVEKTAAAPRLTLLDANGNTVEHASGAFDHFRSR